MYKDNEIEIANFCKDLGLIWRKFATDVSFGVIMQSFMAQYNEYTQTCILSNPKFLDDFYEFLEERFG